MEICRLENVSKEFHTGENVRPLDGVSLTLNAGDFIAIEGPSGIGKSTLLYVLGTLLQPTEGTYHFGGKDVASLNDKEKSALRATKIGFLFQDTNLIQALTLQENIEFVTQGQNDAVAPLLERFGLTDRADFLPYQLSGGQQRRAGAIRSIIHRPQLLLADEPTNDLDEHWAQVMIDTLKEQSQQGAAVVMVTHNRDLAAHAQKKYELRDGKLTALQF